MLKISSICKVSLCLTLFISHLSWAVDIVKMTHSQKFLSERTQYKNEVIKRSLELTEAEYGPYEYHLLKNVRMNRHRALPSVIKGSPNNIYVAPANDEWDEKTIAIKIPIRRGLLNYRLLLVHKADLPKFAKVDTLGDLKKLTAGLRNGWITTDVFRKSNMDFVESQNFDGLFLLLNNHHFDYIPRAIYEIYEELEAREHLLSHVVVEPTLALHLPMPTYIYISPTVPRVAERIEKGLRKMLESGELDEILNKYYADDIKRADLKNRKVINMDNPYYQEHDLLSDKSLWYKVE